MTNLEDQHLSSVDRFVDNESVTRFDVSPPIHLLDWKPLNERVASDEKDSSTPEHEWQGNPEKGRETMIKGMWKRLRNRLEKDGYQSLLEMESRLETYKAEEQSKVHQLDTEHYATREYEDLLERLIDELGPEKEIVTALNKKVSLQPKYDLSWEASPTGFLREQTGIKEITSDEPRKGLRFEWKGSLRLADGYIKEYGFSQKADTKFEFKGDEEVNSVYERVCKIDRTLEREQNERKNLLRLVRFRLKLLQRFLWTLEVAGKTVPEPTDGNEIPAAVDGHDTLVKHACCILNLKSTLLNEAGEVPEKGNLPTQKELQEYVKDAYDITSIGVSSRAVVEGSAKLIRKVLFEDEYDGFRSGFYKLLFENEDLIFKIADKKDLDLPEPRGKKGG